MKLLGIGDLFIPGGAIRKGVEPLAKYGVEIHTVDWELDGFDQLQHINLEIEQHGPNGYPVPEAIQKEAEDAEILLTQFFPVGRELIRRCRKLRVIGVLRGGYENVDLAAAREAGISVFHTPGRNAESVSDFAVGLMICEARNIARGHHGIKTGHWIRTYPNSASIPDLAGRTVGLIGYGQIGRLVAQKLSGFRMRILIHDPFVADVETVSLETLLQESDFVSLHARLTPENERLIGAKELAQMKPTAYLINTSRSGLIDEAALVEALKAGRLAGAALDVFDKEPPGPDHPLVGLENVTLTPHMAGGSQDAFLNTPRLLAADLEHLFDGSGKPCRFRID